MFSIYKPSARNLPNTRLTAYKRLQREQTDGRVLRARQGRGLFWPSHESSGEALHSSTLTRHDHAHESRTKTYPLSHICVLDYAVSRPVALSSEHPVRLRWALECHLPFRVDVFRSFVDSGASMRPRPIKLNRMHIQDGTLMGGLSVSIIRSVVPLHQPCCRCHPEGIVDYILAIVRILLCRCFWKSVSHSCGPSSCRKKQMSIPSSLASALMSSAPSRLRLAISS